MDLKDISKTMENALINMSEGDFQKAGIILNENKDNIREEIQRETSGEIQMIISKLGKNDELSSEDIDLIELWIVGDAEGYIKMENNLQDWLQEFERLEGELRKYENKGCSINDLFRLQGILEDALRINYDISYFLEKKARIERFRTAMSTELNEDDRETLKELLLNMLQSPDY